MGHDNYAFEYELAYTTAMRIVLAIEDTLGPNPCWNFTADVYVMPVGAA